MAKRFLLLSMPKAQIAEGRENWIPQLVDLIETAECADVAATYPTATLLSKQAGSEGWSTDTAFRRKTNETGFDTYGFDCGGFTSSMASVLKFEVPDSIILVAEEDQEAFVEICKAQNIDLEVIK